MGKKTTIKQKITWTGDLEEREGMKHRSHKMYYL